MQHCRVYLNIIHYFRHDFLIKLPSLPDFLVYTYSKLNCDGFTSTTETSLCLFPILCTSISNVYSITDLVFKIDENFINLFNISASERVNLIFRSSINYYKDTTARLLNTNNVTSAFHDRVRYSNHRAEIYIIIFGIVYVVQSRGINILKILR